MNIAFKWLANSSRIGHSHRGIVQRDSQRDAARVSKSAVSAEYLHCTETGQMTVAAQTLWSSVFHASNLLC